MMTEIIFVLFLGLIVFGPRKTLEMAQKLGGVVAKFKHAATQLQSELTAQAGDPPPSEQNQTLSS
jgi:Sec-independent protein translocase protein TatA